ncbi:MAG TPA: SDR family oxidoreductase [Solirubrobacteraceae bacterium]|nr:SDR family oxidoreductase [Solirubrobacteraceae bacterium]
MGRPAKSDFTDALFSIARRRTVITGGTAGIGLGVARHFVSAGADVVVTGRREQGHQRADSVGATFVRMDVRDDASVERALADAVRALGGLDILILNAGIARPCGPLEALDLDTFREVLEVNLFGVMRGLRYGLAHMERGGVVLVTSSPGGRQALAAPGTVAYSASKAALDMVVQSAGLELADRGIRVSGVIPGFINTEIAAASPSPPTWLARLTATGEARDAEAMGPVFHFLASDAGSMLQASVVAADDGCSAGLSSSVLSRLVGA